MLDANEEQLILLAKKVQQNLKNNLVEDNLAVDFLRVIPKLNQEQRAAVQKILDDKKIILNELYKEDFVQNVGLKNFKIVHKLGYWLLHKNLFAQILKF